MSLPLIESRLVQEARITKPSPGVSLILRPTDANEIAAVEIVLPMGGREEPPEQAGVGSLALRMLTRGTKSKSDYEIAVGFESLGASFSAEVQKDRAVLSVQTTLHRFEETLQLVREVLTEPTFPAEFFEVEKEILRKEILEDLDSPYYAASKLFQASVFGDHPYAFPNTGTLETVESLTRDRTLEFFHERFGRGPVSIGVVGNLGEDRVSASLEGFYEVLGVQEASSPSPPPTPSTSDNEGEVYEERSIDSECMFYGFPVPGMHSPEYATLKVIDSILGGSMDSRLFSEVREKQGLVYQIGSSYPGLEWGSYFAVSLITTAPNHHKVLETLAREIEKISSTLPDEEEVERAKTYLKGTYLMSQEKNSDQALLLARCHSLGLGIDYVNRYPRMIDSVTPEAVVEVCGRFFQNPTLAIVGPGADEAVEG